MAWTNSLAQEGDNSPIIHISVVFPGSRGLPKSICVGRLALSWPTALKSPCCELGFASSLLSSSDVNHHLLASFYSPISLKLSKTETNLLVLHLHGFQLAIPISHCSAQTQLLPAGPSPGGHTFLWLHSVYMQEKRFLMGCSSSVPPIIPTAPCHTPSPSSGFSPPWWDTADYFRESFQAQSLRWIFQAMSRYPNLQLLKEQTTQVCINTGTHISATTNHKHWRPNIGYFIWPLTKSQSKVIPDHKYSWLSQQVQTEEAQTWNLEGKCRTASNPPPVVSP